MTRHRHRALDAPCHQVAVRRLAISEAELPAKVTSRHVHAAGERFDVQRLRVFPVDPVPDAAQQHEVAQMLLLRLHRFGQQISRLLGARRSPRSLSAETWALQTWNWSGAPACEHTRPRVEVLFNATARSLKREKVLDQPPSPLYSPRSLRHRWSAGACRLLRPSPCCCRESRGCPWEPSASAGSLSSGLLRLLYR